MKRLLCQGIEKDLFTIQLLSRCIMFDSIQGYYNILLISEEFKPRGGELFIENDNPKKGKPHSHKGGCARAV